MPTPPPTLVSTFEILFTPQLPPGLGPPAVQQIDEQVIKGFFLTIANPSPTTYALDLGFHCNTAPAPTPAARTLASAVAFIDDATTGTPLTLSPTSSGTDFYARVTIAPRGTVLVGILPAFFNATGLITTAIECRGWVDLTLPALLRAPYFFETFPQSPTPITLLLTPEQRLTFLPMPGDAATTVQAQSAFALPVATGTAAAIIPPQPAGFIRPLFGGPLDLSTAETAALEHLAYATPARLQATLAALTATAPAVQSGQLTPQEALRTLGLPTPQP